jgi:HAD superfamily phosphoserine phosphatase-like hydrolase
MHVTLFDLDHTLLPLDTNQAWVAFLCDTGALDKNEFLPAAAAMKARYLAGGNQPDVVFCEFFIGILTRFTGAERDTLRQRFVTEIVMPAISPKARLLIEQHRSRDDALAIITATNRFITEPIAAAFGIEHLIATECEVRQQHAAPGEVALAGEQAVLTGRVSGIPSMRSGKVTRLVSWLASGALPGVSTRAEIELLRFYSDSINDRALLEECDQPIAVDPDEQLRTLARERRWPVISLL